MPIQINTLVSLAETKSEHQWLSEPKLVQSIHVNINELTFKIGQ